MTQPDMTKIQSILRKALKDYGLTSETYEPELIVAFITVDLIRGQLNIPSSLPTVHTVESPTPTRRRQTPTQTPLIPTIQIAEEANTDDEKTTTN